MKAPAPLLAAVIVCALGAAWWHFSRVPLPAEQNCEAGGACEVPREPETSAIEATPVEPETTTPVSQTAPASAAPKPSPATPEANPATGSPAPNNLAAEVPTSDPAASPAALREAAKAYFAQGQLAPALETLRDAVTADPNDAESQGDLGNLLVQLTDFDNGLMHLRRAADLDPNNADRWIALANGYYRKVDPGEALKAEKRAREVESGLVLGWGTDGMRIRIGGAPIAEPE